MSQQIIVEGTTEEIAQSIAAFPGKIVKAILVVESPEGEDGWTRDFRRWAASHKPEAGAVDYGRESIYEDRLE